MFGTPPPYALAAPTFHFPALAARAARGQLGSDRELALAAFVAARLVAGALPPRPLPTAIRVPRAQTARGWFASLSLPTAARAPLARLAAATATDDPAAIAAALSAVLDIASRALDSASRSELESLHMALSR